MPHFFGYLGCECGAQFRMHLNTALYRSLKQLLAFDSKWLDLKACLDERLKLMSILAVRHPRPSLHLCNETAVTQILSASRNI